MQHNFFQLIVDSASGLFRTDFSGRGELAERQVLLHFFKVPMDLPFSQNFWSAKTGSISESAVKN